MRVDVSHARIGPDLKTSVVRAQRRRGIERHFRHAIERLIAASHRALQLRRFIVQKALLTEYYERYLQDQDSTAFIRRTSARYTVGTLERLLEHPRRDVRRSAAMALGYLATYGSNQALGRALCDDDRTVRLLAESGIRNLWTRAGSAEQRQRLGVVIQLNLSQQYSEAILCATELIEEASHFAEVWNQRAIAQYNLGRFAESIRDCHQALEINPYHFGAAAGMGQCYLQLGQRVYALESFRRALRLNPNLEGIRAGIAHLERILRQESQ